MIADPVVVTGASGFIGRHVVRELHARGVQVRAIGRSRRFQEHAGIAEFVAADIADPAFLERALDGAAAVVHLAGRAHLLRDPSADPRAAFHLVNVELTQTLAAVAAASGVHRFVLMSSMAAAEEATGGGAERLRHPVALYAQSKRDAEAAAFAAANGGPMRVIALRPPLVYGPGMKGNPLRLFSAIAGMMPLPLGRIRNTRSVLFVGNLVAAVCAALDDAHDVHGIFEMADEEQISSAEFARRIGLALGRRARVVPIPVRLLRLAGRLGDLASGLVHVPLTSYEVERLTGSLRADPARFIAATGYRASTTMEEGLRETARWYVNAGNAPGDSAPST